MEQYHNLLKKIVCEGDVFYEPRTKTNLIGVSSASYTVDLREGFPLLTTKYIPPRLPFEELFWKLRGERNISSLVERNVHFWTANAFDRYLKLNGLKEKFPKHSAQWNDEFNRYKMRISEDPKFAESAGDLGPVYGFQWRHWRKRDGGEVDQLENLINGIRNRPGSRYHVLSSWNPGDLGDMALGPCPFWHQFTVYGDNLDLTMVQRSCDTYLGVPFNDAQDALLLEMVAGETGLKPRFFHHHFINTHIYLGVPPRSDFWNDKGNVAEFKKRFGEVTDKEDYLKLRDWYILNSGSEGDEDQRKDHMPFVLEQLSKTPMDLPKVRINSDISMFEAIKMRPEEVVSVENYNPPKWDSKAVMAA